MVNGPLTGQSPSQDMPMPRTSRRASDLGYGFWLSLIGGIVGINVGLFLAYDGSIFDPFGWSSINANRPALIIASLSVLGLIGGFLEGQKVVGGILLVISGVGIILFATWMGWFTAALFLLGGGAILFDSWRERSKEASTVSPAPRPQRPEVREARPSFPELERPAPKQQETSDHPARPFFPELMRSAPERPSPPPKEVRPIYRELETDEPSPDMPASEQERPAALDEQVGYEGSEEEMEEYPRRVLSERDRRNNIIAFIAVVVILLSAMLAAWVLYA